MYMREDKTLGIPERAGDQLTLVKQLFMVLLGLGKERWKGILADNEVQRGSHGSYESWVTIKGISKYLTLFAPCFLVVLGSF